MRFNPKKILIVLHGSIGDVTRALPLANLIRGGFPDAHLVWSVEPPSLPLVERYPAVQEIILFDRRRWWREWLPFLRRVRAHHFDLVLDLQRHFKSGVITRWSGAPHRLGFNRRDLFRRRRACCSVDQGRKTYGAGRHHRNADRQSAGCADAQRGWRHRLRGKRRSMVSRHCSKCATRTRTSRG